MSKNKNDFLPRSIEELEKLEKELGIDSFSPRENKNTFEQIIEAQPSFESCVELEDWLKYEFALYDSFYKDKFIMFFLSPKYHAKITGGKMFRNLKEYIEYFKKMPASTLFVGVTSENGQLIWGMNCRDFTVEFKITSKEPLGEQIYRRKKS